LSKLAPLPPKPTPKKSDEQALADLLAPLSLDAFFKAWGGK